MEEKIIETETAGSDNFQIYEPKKTIQSLLAELVETQNLQKTGVSFFVKYDGPVFTACTKSGVLLTDEDEQYIQFTISEKNTRLKNEQVRQMFEEVAKSKDNKPECLIFVLSIDDSGKLITDLLICGEKDLLFGITNNLNWN